VAGAQTPWRFWVVKRIVRGFSRFAAHDLTSGSISLFPDAVPQVQPNAQRCGDLQNPQ
jgi:hypothetical protein